MQNQPLIATLLFVAPVIYKPFALIALFLLAFITFETVNGGLTTALSQRQEALGNTEQISELEENNEFAQKSCEASSSTLETIQNQINSLEEARAKEIDRFEKQIDEIRKSSIPIDTQTQINLYEKEINRVDEALANLKITIETDEAKDQSKFQDQQLSFTEQIKVYTENGDRKNANKIQNKLDRLPNPANKAPWKERRKEYQEAVNKLEKDKSEYIKSREEIFANLTVNPEVTLEIERLQKERERTLKNISDQIQNLYSQKADFAQSQFDKLDKQSQNLRDAEMLEQQLIQLSSEKASMANKNQIRQLAATWYSVSAVDISDEQERFITKVYVYSLAGLAALAGPITAIVALALQSIAAREKRKLLGTQPKTTRDKFWISLRKFFIRAKHKRRQTVIKEVQVEVEKPVEKIVEVPVKEKEFIYIPILTDDPEKMMEDLQKKLPKEAFERIKVGLANC